MGSMEQLQPPRPKGRPRGKTYGPSVRAALHLEVFEAAKAARKILGVSMSELIRLGVQNKLAEAAQKCIDIARSEETTPSQKLKAIQFLDQARWAAEAVAIHPREMDKLWEVRRKIYKLARHPSFKLRRRSPRPRMPRPPTVTTDGEIAS